MGTIIRDCWKERKKLPSKKWTQERSGIRRTPSRYRYNSPTEVAQPGSSGQSDGSLVGRWLSCAPLNEKRPRVSKETPYGRIKIMAYALRQFGIATGDVRHIRGMDFEGPAGAPFGPIDGNRLKHPPYLY